MRRSQAISSILILVSTGYGFHPYQTSKYASAQNKMILNLAAPNIFPCALLFSLAFSKISVFEGPRYEARQLTAPTFSIADNSAYDNVEMDSTPTRTLTEEDSDQEEDLNTLKRVTKSSQSTDPSLPKNNLVDQNLLSDEQLELSREIVLTLKAYIDEAERDLFQSKFSNVIVYLNTISDQETAFTDLIDGLYTTDDPIDVAAKESMQFEAKSLFMALDDLRAALQNSRASAAEKYYAKVLLYYDRFLKAGDLYPTYDVITSTEIFFKDTPLATLRFDEVSPVRKLDTVILKTGPDMGKTGRAIYIDGKYAIVKLDKDGKEYQEVKRVPLSMLSKCAEDAPRKNLNKKPPS